MTFPTHLDIDLSTKCNLRCRFCHLSFYKPKSWTQLNLDQFVKLDPLLRNLKSISLFSKFEVLTCRDFLKIFDIINCIVFIKVTYELIYNNKNNYCKAKIYVFSLHEKVSFLYSLL